MVRLKSQASGANEEIEGLVQELEAHAQDLTSKLEDLKEQLADKDEILQKHKGHIGKLSCDIKDLKAVHAIDLET
jgi:peptidoglycan hydrolase CwlO-like protein